MCLITENMYGVDDINQTVSDLKVRVNNLENVVGIKNRFIPAKDADVLYKIVFGDNNVTINGYSIKFDRSYKYKFNPWYEGELVKNNDTDCSDANKSMMEVKLEAVESALKISDVTGKSLNTRIRDVYAELNYDDWDRDRIRFVVLTNYVEGIGKVVPSIGVEVFPSYKKYIPGNLDFSRRYAIYLGVGQTEKVDNAVYSVGINIEIQNGFGINFGGATYTIDNNKHTNLTYGIVLSSEIWKALF